MTRFGMFCAESFCQGGGEDVGHLGQIIHSHLTLLGLQPRFGDKPLEFSSILSPNGTAVLKGFMIYGSRSSQGQVDCWSV